jgi:hypothetical protein
MSKLSDWWNETQTISTSTENISTEKINFDKVDSSQLEATLFKLFEKYKDGFAMILFANIITLITALFSTFIIFNSNSLSDIQTTYKVVLFVSLISYVIVLYGLFKLYNASELRKSSEK